MSPRIKILRKITNPPVVKGFKPYGLRFENTKMGKINLLYEEYEAIRLSDYEKLNHHQASMLMGVSRPTFTRIYASALQKIAKAMVEGRPISIEGGKVYFDSDWYHCKRCKCYFNYPEKEKSIAHCALCGSQEIERFTPQDMDEQIQNFGHVCVCLNCGFEQKHPNGQLCGLQICPQCQSLLKRKGHQKCRKIKN